MSQTIFFNSMVTVHIKPTAPHHTTVLTASVKKILLPVLSHTLFLLDYRKTWPKMEPWPKVDVLPYFLFQNLHSILVTFFVRLLKSLLIIIFNVDILKYLSSTKAIIIGYKNAKKRGCFKFAMGASAENG